MERELMEIAEARRDMVMRWWSIREKCPSSLEGGRQRKSVKAWSWTKGMWNALGSTVDEVNVVLDGEVGSPVTDFDQSIEVANRSDGSRLLKVNGGVLQQELNRVSRVERQRYASPLFRRLATERAKRSSPPKRQTTTHLRTLFKIRQRSSTRKHNNRRPFGMVQLERIRSHDSSNPRSRSLDLDLNLRHRSMIFRCQMGIDRR